MSRPRLKIPYDVGDRIMEVLSAIALILLITVTAFYYSELPQRVPIHYDARGVADGYGNKSTLLLLPLIGVLIYVGLTILSRFPHIFNYPVKITTQNAQRQYSLALKLLNLLKLTMVVLFTVISYSSIMTSMGNYTGFGAWFIPASLFIIFGSIGVYFYLSLKTK